MHFAPYPPEKSFSLKKVKNKSMPPFIFGMVIKPSGKNAPKNSPEAI